MNIEKIDGYMQRNAIIDTNTKPIIDCTDRWHRGEQGEAGGAGVKRRERELHTDRLCIARK